MAAPDVNLRSWLAPEQIHVVFAGTSWRLQATTAGDWMAAIAYDFTNLSGVFPGLVCDEELDSMYELIRDQDQLARMPAIAQQVVQAAGGRDWWWTVNLIRKATAGWIYINGVLVRQGIRAGSTSLPDWLDACYTWMYERNDENGRIALDTELGLPPKGVKGSAKQTREMLAAFQAD